MAEQSEEIVKRLLGGPEGNGWSCDFASEMDLISEAALEIRGLSREVERLRKIKNDALWLARLASSSSWPVDMAQQVENAAERVKAAFSGSPAEETP